MAYSIPKQIRGGLAVALFMAVSSTCVAQQNYYDYSATQRTTFYFDDFSDNRNNWWKGSDKTSGWVDTGAGVYNFKSELGKDKYAWSAQNLDNLDTSRDFEIETSIQHISGPNTMQGLAFGLKDADNYFILGVSGNGYYRVGKEKDGNWTNIVDWTQADFVSTTGFNKLTVRKVGSYVYYFVNQNFVHKELFLPFIGSRIGFFMYDSLWMKADYIRISYLNKSQTTNGVITTSLNRSTSGKTIATVDESFLNNDNNWWEGESDTYQAKVENGYYRITNKKKNDRSVYFFSPQKFKPSDSNDFLIEVSLRYVSGGNNGPHGIVFGLDKENYNAFYFLISATQWYKVQVKRDGKNRVDLKEWTKADFINPSSYNKLAVKKVDGTYFFYVNDHLVYEAPYEPFFGSSLAFESYQDLTINLDNFRISYLNADDDPKMIITEYINNRIKRWQEKGKFETTEAYKARVNEQSRNQMIESLTTHVVDSLGKVHTSLVVEKTDYDADNETFRLYFKDKRSLYLNVPLAEAPVFDKNLNRLRFENTSYAFTADNEFVLREAWIVNPVNNQRYHYNSGQSVAFNTVDFALNFDPIDIGVQSEDIQQNVLQGQTRIEVGKADVDVNIPKTTRSNPNAIAVVVGIRDYQNPAVPDVAYAENDAQIMRKYLTDVLGYDAANILPRNPNQVMTAGALKTLIRRQLPAYVREGQSDVFVYYSGHGAPSTANQQAYLVPSDADPNFVSDDNAYALSSFYQDLAALKAKSLTVVMDACFTGQSGGGQMMIRNASPLMMTVKNPLLAIPNATVFSASASDQVANWYPQKGHGMFTYFFLKGLRGEADSDGNGAVTTGEMEQFLLDSNKGVPYWSNREFQRPQTPQVVASDKANVLVRH